MSDLVLRLEDVNLVFNTSVYRSWTWREAFVRATKDPLSILPNGNDRLHVCEDISFTIKRGEKVALIGVNGAGKTSLCRCIAGFFSPTLGKVVRVGTVRALFDVAVGIQPELTGRENAYLLAELLFPEEARRKEIVREALDFSELGDFLDVPFKVYSKGMQARLGLSLSAMKPADLLILDEVFDGADIFFREKIALRMLEVMRDSGAVIFVSHSPDQIVRICDRLLLLNDRKIVFDGPVEEGLAVFYNLKPPDELRISRS